MADNTRGGSNDATLPLIATDDVGGVQYQRVKLDVGADGATSPVVGTVPVSGSVTAEAGTGPYPVSDNGGSLTVDGTVTVTGVALDATLGTTNTEIGGLTEIAPATDTASSGLNGRLQRIAQRLTSLIALLPASLGQKTKTGSLAVTLASDQDALPVTDNGGSLTVDGSVAVSSLPSIPAGTNNIGDVDVLTVPAPLSTTGGGTEAAALRVTVATDSTGVLSVDDNGGSLTVDGTVTANLAAGTNNIGDVDVLTVPAPLSTTGNGTAAAALRVTIASDTTGVLAVTDNGGSLTVDNGGTFAVQVSSALPTGANAIGKLAANDGIDIGDVTVNNAAGASAVNIQDGGNSITVDGTVAVSGTTTTKEIRAATPTQSSVAGSASSVTIIASNANRLGGTVWNDSTALLYLKLGATASTSSFTVRMSSQSYFELPYGYTGVVDGIWASATGNARVTELAA